MPAAVVAAIVGAAGTVAGKAIEANASGNASKTQAQTAEEALQFEKEQLARKQAALEPYEDIGLGAGKQLAYLTGVTPSQNAGGSAPMPQSTAPFQPNATVSLNGGPPLQRVVAPDGSTKTVDPKAAQVLIGFGGYKPYGQPQQGGNMSALAAPSMAPSMPQTSSAGVTMRAPDGTTQVVPAAQVAHYQQLGAVPVGTA